MRPVPAGWTRGDRVPDAASEIARATGFSFRARARARATWKFCALLAPRPAYLPRTRNERGLFNKLKDISFIIENSISSERARIYYVYVELK